MTGRTPQATWTPPDKGARDTIDSDLGRSVFAVAGAGSGKTRHLVERVKAVLVSGAASIDEVAVITFTEAAAAELRDRLAVALESSSASDEPEEAARARHALEGLDAAAVTTLHGFARRVLSEHALEAGLPPAFEVLDEAASIAALDERWAETVDALVSDEVRAVSLQRLLVAGGQLGALRALASSFVENWDRVAVTRRPRDSVPPITSGAVVASLEGALAQAGHCMDREDALLCHLDALGPYATALREAAGDELETLRLLAHSAPPIKTGRGRKEVWNGKKKAVTELLDAAERARSAAVSEAIDAALRAVADGLGTLSVEAAERRRREGRVHFHDLLVLACRLVRDRGDVREALHRRYTRLFVDEFQDTDPLQAELVTMIAAEPGAPVGRAHWWRLPTVPGALFFVGDPLQSIYAFRRADVATFLRTLDDVPSTVAHLEANFRSVPGIVEWTNAVFERLVGDGQPDVQPGFRRSVPAPSETAGAGPAAVWVLGAACADEDTGGRDGDGSSPRRAEEVRTAEAAQLAALVRRAVDEGWPAGDGGAPLRLDDVAVLVRARASVPALERAFEAHDIAYRLESSSLVYGAPEVHELLQVLRAIDDPSDAASLVAALRSPGLGCGDDDLVGYRLAGGEWDFRKDAPDSVVAGDPVRMAMARLMGWHRRARWEGVSELVTRVVADLRQLDAALDSPRWREEWRRLRFIVDQARQFAEGGGGGLRDYLRWVDVQSQEDARVTEIVLPESDAPAVSVMTVHAAKGLEFPFVGVLGFGSRPQGVVPPAVLFSGTGVELALSGSLKTSGFDRLRREGADRDEHERLRLLYVAVTRAKRHLVVSVHRPSGAGRCVAAQLEGVLGAPELRPLWAAPDDAPAMADGDAGASPDTGVDAASDPATGPGALARWEAARAERLGARPRVVAATSVPKLAAPEGEEPDDGEPDAPDEGPDPAADGALRAAALWRRGRGATSVGRAVHAVLQLVDLETGHGLEELARAQAAREGIAARHAEVAALARAALDSEVVAAAARSPHWREIYVGAPFGDGVVEGFVDLLFEGPDGLEVLDYKTDRLAREEDVDRLVDRYRLQGAAYAAAVESATSRPVVRCRFLFLRAQEAVAREVPDLRRAIAQVRAIMAGGAPPRAGQS